MLPTYLGHQLRQQNASPTFMIPPFDLNSQASARYKCRYWLPFPLNLRLHYLSCINSLRMAPWCCHKMPSLQLLFILCFPLLWQPHSFPSLLSTHNLHRGKPAHHPHAPYLFSNGSLNILVHVFLPPPQPHPQKKERSLFPSLSFFFRLLLSVLPLISPMLSEVKKISTTISWEKTTT